MTAQTHLTGIRTVLLGVASLDRSLAFYRDQLGLSVSMQFEGFAFLLVGDLTLGLSEGVAKYHATPPGAMEVVFSVSAVQAAYESLKSRGVEFKNEPRPVTPTDWGANFDDPDGHHLSIFGPRGS